MKNKPRSSRQPDFVYGTGGANGGLVFLPPDVAEEWANLHRAIYTSRTWREFRSRVSNSRYEEITGLMDGACNFEDFYADGLETHPTLTRQEAVEEYRTFEIGKERLPLDDDPFDWMQIYGLSAVGDGLWPEWPEQEMFGWMPEDLPYAEVQDSIHDGFYLSLDPEHEAEIVAALEQRGYHCVKDQALISEASGYRPCDDFEDDAEDDEV